MARTSYIKCCDDDTWPEEDHLKDILKFMTTNELDFTHCFRRMWTRDGQKIGIDEFEAIGERNKFGYHLLDNSSLFYNQKAANVLVKCFCKKVYGDDRYTYEPLHQYCKGKRYPGVLTNHMAQPHLESFFKNIAHLNEKKLSCSLYTKKEIVTVSLIAKNKLCEI